MIIRVINTVLEDYETGMSVVLLIEFFNPDATAPFDAKIYDLETGSYLGGFGDVLTVGGDKVYNFLAGTMKEESWKLRVEVEKEGEVTDSKVFTVPLRSPPIEPPEDVEDEEPPPVIPPVLPPKDEDLPDGLLPPTIPPEVGITTVEVSSLPWYAAWLEPLANYVGAVFANGINFLHPLFTPLGMIGAFFADPVGIIVNKLGTIFQRSTQEGINESLKAIDAATGDSPEFSKDIETKLTGFTDKLVGDALGKLTPEALGESPLAPADAAQKLTVVGGVIQALSIGTYIANAIGESATLGQLEAIGRISEMVIGNLGIADLGRQALTLPLEALLTIPARQHYMNLFTPIIPSSGELINQVVKEVITVDEFRKTMRFHGFSEVYSQQIWDAHFIAPSLGQMLKMYLRGRWGEVGGDAAITKLTDMQILVDLDPRFNDIWKEQWHNDPSITQARFMFEVGAIDEAAVKDIVVRSGLVPEYVDRFTDFIVRFQERFWRRRYLIAMARGYREGVFTSDELTAEITKAGYTSGVAEWMINTEDVRAKIVAAKPTVEREIELPISIVSDAYYLDEQDIDWVKGKLSDRGYDDDEIDAYVTVLENKKENKEIGVKTGGLTVSQVLTAMKKRSLTIEGRESEEGKTLEDLLEVDEGEKTRAKELLLLKGLSDEFADVLISTARR